MNSLFFHLKHDSTSGKAGNNAQNNNLSMCSQMREYGDYTAYRGTRVINDKDHYSVINHKKDFYAIKKPIGIHVPRGVFNSDRFKCVNCGRTITRVNCPYDKITCPVCGCDMYRI